MTEQKRPGEAKPDDTVGVRDEFGAPKTQAQMLLDNFCWPVICTTINGLERSLPQFDIATLLVRTSGLVGRVIGQKLSMGDLSSILQIRAECVKAFTEGVRSVKPQLAPTGPDAPQFDPSKLKLSS